MALDIEIRTEQDAWSWLKRALDGDIREDEAVNLRFVGWPTLDLGFQGKDFHSSVPTRLMPAMLEAQKEVHRLYSQVRYGEQNLRRLTAEDRDRLELVVNVEDGSSIFNVDLDGALTEAFRSAVAKMKPVHLVTIMLGCALAWGSTVAWKDWLQNQAEMKEIDARVQMSQLEKEKLQVLNEARHQIPEVKELTDGVDEFRNDSLHKLKPSDTFVIPGSDVVVDGDYAAKITHTPREQSTEIRVDGEFTILAVVSGDTDGYKLKVRRNLDARVLNVSIPEDSLTRDQLEILKHHEWGKKPVLLEIDARILRGQITAAVLMSVAEIKKVADLD